MNTVTILSTSRAANAKGQFILPEIPTATSPALSAMIEEYHIGFVSEDEAEQPRWGAAARHIHGFEPKSVADLLSKMIIAIHYRDPECDGRQLAIGAPETAADQLAVEIELDCLDWLLASAVDPSADHAEWDVADLAYERANADLEALAIPYADEEVDRLADIRGDAIDAILDLPATTVAQALRKIELAMFDNQMVRTGVDFSALLADAQRLAGHSLEMGATGPVDTTEAKMWERDNHRVGAAQPGEDARSQCEESPRHPAALNH